jgi:hypothetical protein
VFRNFKTDFVQKFNEGKNVHVSRVYFFSRNGSIRVFCSAAGLPDGIFSVQNPNLGKLWRVLQWTVMVYFMDI